jgi:hypothetical protein
MAENRMSRNAWTFVAGVVCLCAAPGTPTTWADSNNPAVTCHDSAVGGIEQDICAGKPGASAGVTPRDDYPGIVPRLRFGLGIGF